MHLRVGAILTSIITHLQAIPSAQVVALHEYGPVAMNYAMTMQGYTDQIKTFSPNDYVTITQPNIP